MPHLEFTPLVDQVYKDLKKRILTGDLKADTKLVIRDLCEYYKISDTPLKQALNRLVSEKMVIAYPRCGMRVVRMTSKDIHEATEARIMIETYAVHAAIEASAKDPSIISALEQNLAEDECLMREHDISSYSEASLRELELSQNFHLIIVRTLKNDTIAEAYVNIYNHRYVYYQNRKDKKEQALASLEEHRKILDCLKAGDEEGMKAAIISHLKTREYDVSTVSEK